MIDLEIAIVFFTSMFFTIIWLVTLTSYFAVVAGVCWNVVGFMWLFIAPMESGYAIGLLFHGVGIILIVFGLLQVIQSIRIRQGSVEPEPSVID